MKYIVKILTLSSALILTVFVVPTVANESNNTSLDSNTSMLFQSKIGKYKTTTTKVSRSYLTKIREDLSNKNLFGSFITLLFPIPGLVQDHLLKKVNYILDDKLKNSYTVTSSFQCEEGYLGARGTVHRYVLKDITIS